MKLAQILIFFLFVSCSTSKKSFETKKIKNSSFHNVTGIKQDQFNDYFVSTGKEKVHVFFDESSEFLNQSELSLSSNDQILKLSVQCRNGKKEESYKFIANITKKYSSIPAFWNTVGACHLIFGNDRKALLFLNKSLELNSDYSPALNNLGIFYLRQNQDQKALLAFEKSFLALKFAKIPRFNLASLYLKYGLVESSRPLVTSLYNEFPNDKDFRELMGIQYLFDGDYKKFLDHSNILKIKEKISDVKLLALAFGFYKTGDDLKFKEVLSRIDSKKLSSDQKFFFNYLISKKEKNK